MRRKMEYKNAKVLSDWIKQRERIKKEMNLELKGDLAVEVDRFCVYI
jgi:hypothetical protein